MPAWYAINLSTLESHSCAPLLEVCRSVATDTVVDRFPQIRDGVVQRVRMAIASGGYDLDADETKIPKDLISTACWLIIEQLITAIPIGVSFNEDQRSTLRREWDQLNAVRDGKLAVSEPETVADPSGAQASTASVSIVSAPARNFTRSQLSRL